MIRRNRPSDEAGMSARREFEQFIEEYKQYEYKQYGQKKLKKKKPKTTHQLNQANIKQLNENNNKRKSNSAASPRSEGVWQAGNGIRPLSRTQEECVERIINDTRNRINTISDSDKD